MKKFLLLMFTLLLNIQNAYALNVDALMDKYIAPVSDKIASLIFFPITIGTSQVPIIIFWVLFEELNVVVIFEMVFDVNIECF